MNSIKMNKSNMDSTKSNSKKNKIMKLKENMKNKKKMRNNNMTDKIPLELKSKLKNRIKLICHKKSFIYDKENKTIVPKVSSNSDIKKSNGDKNEINNKNKNLSSWIITNKNKFFKTIKVSDRKLKARSAKVRKSIEPGKILILLSSCFKGKRVICLGVLPSGLLLVTGPFLINGVPLRRINPRYVIATSTKIDLSNLNLDLSKFNDEYFKSNLHQKGKSIFNDSGNPKGNNNDEMERNKDKSSSIFINQDENENKKGSYHKISSDRKSDQLTVDLPILKKLKRSDPLLTKYLKSKFTLRSGMFPHLLKF